MKQTTNNKKKKRAKLGQNISKTLTYKHDLATKINQLNVKAVKHASQNFPTSTAASKVFN